MLLKVALDFCKGKGTQVNVAIFNGIMHVAEYLAELNGQPNHFPRIKQQPDAKETGSERDASENGHIR